MTRGNAINWEKLSQDSALEVGAAWLVDRDVWVGLLTPEGRSVGIGESKRLSRNPTPNENLVGENSLTEWVEAVEHSGGSVFQAQSEVGLSARIAPCRVDGQIRGAVYASGFRVEGEKGEANSPVLGEELLVGLVDTLEALRRRVEHRLTEESAGETDSAWHRDGVVRFEGMVAASDEMRERFDEVSTLAPTDATVLITGENGTGKEMVARAIHRRSRRSETSFVPINCASLSPQLVASELFGHVEGAFSGANRTRKGVLETADGGTLLLDEIGEMSSKLQAQLLRFLEDGEFSPVGSNERRQADVRVLCATNRSLTEAVEEGEFRRDLFFRVSTARIRIPPLRDRRGDIAPLAEHFLADVAGDHGREELQLTEAALAKLRNHTWPGNVRQLRNVIERAAIRAPESGTIDAEDIQIEKSCSHETVSGFAPAGMTLPAATEKLERHMIRRALDETGWNKTQAAEQLDVSRRTLIRKVDDYGLSPDDA